MRNSNSKMPTEIGELNRDLVPRELYEGPGKIGSKNFVYKALEVGDIPSYRIGQKLFIPRNWRDQISKDLGKR